MYTHRVFNIFLFEQILSAQSEKKTFSDYAHYVSKVMDIHWKKPRHFIDLEQGASWWGPRDGMRNKRIGCSYKSTLQSNDGNCLVLYSDMDIMLSLLQMKDIGAAFKMLVGEMHMALGLVDEKGKLPADIAFDFKAYVKTILEKQVLRELNADTVYIAQIPLEKAFRTNYLYCTGLYIIKEGRPSILVKCFFTDEGKKNEEKYLRSIFRSIEYQNNDWKYDDEKCLKERYKYHLKTR